MRRALLVVLFVAPLFAGCAQNPLTPASAVETAPLAHPLRYVVDALGTNVSAPEELKDGFAVVEHLVGHRGGEPNIGVTSRGNVFTTAGHNTLRSEDHGQTWKIVFNLSEALPQNCNPAPAIPQPVGCPITQVTRSSDPMLWVDPITNRIFTDHMTGLYCSNMITSDDEGATWLMKPLTCGIPVNDHQKIATSIGYGPAAKATNPVYPNVVYYCYNKLLTTECAVSLDGGHQFAYDRPVFMPVDPASGDNGADLNGCAGINGSPAPHPDGSMLLAVGTDCPEPRIAVTEDNGLTWVIHKGPKEKGSEEIDPDITVTKDGTAYLLARGKDHLQYLYRSKDKFVHWDGPWLVSPPDVTSSVFAGITSGDDGRIAMSYLGTRDTKEEPSKAENATRWHLFVTMSLDSEAEDPTFVTQQVTPDADPVQIGCVWLGGGGNPCRNMLDFIDMTSDKDGRIYVAITDGCTTGCANTPGATNEQSRARDGAVAVLEGGPSLRAGKPIAS